MAAFRAKGELSSHLVSLANNGTLKPIPAPLAYNWRISKDCEIAACQDALEQGLKKSVRICCPTFVP
jgi:hypothetical protein